MNRFSRLAIWLVILIDGVVLLGWGLNVEILKSILPGHTAATPNAAAGLLLAAASRWLLQRDSRTLRTLSRIAASVVTCIGGLTLVEYAGHVNLHTDQLMFRVPATAPGRVYPGQMAVTAAMGLALLGCSLLLMGTEYRRRRIVADLLAIPVFTVALLALCGHLLNLDELETLAAGSNMSLPVAVAFTLLSAGLPCTWAEHGILRILASDGTGGFVLRRLLPLTFVVPPVFVWAVAQGAKHGLYAAKLDAILIATALMLVMVAVVFWNAYSLDRIDSSRRRVQRVLQNSRDQWELTFNCMSEGLSYHDPEYNIIGANEAIYSLLGHARLAGAKCYEVFHGSNCPPEYCPMRRTLASGRTESSEFFSPELGRHLNVRTDPVLGPDGRVLRVIHVVNDITERKQAEAAIRRLAAIVESTDDAIIGKDLDGRITSWNRAAERMYGYTEAEALGQPVTILYPPEHKEQAALVLAKIRSGRRIESQEAQRIRRDCTRIDVSLTISPIHNAEGKVIGASAIARDITAHKQATEEALQRGLEAQQARARLDAVLASMGEGLYQLDENGNLVYLNPAGERMLGYSLKDIRGRNMHDLLHSHRPDGNIFPGHDCLLTRVLQGSESHDEQQDYFRRSDGSCIPVEYTSSALVLDGQITGVVLSFRDISERKRAEGQERRARREVEAKSTEIARLNAELEQRVRLRTAELETANRELEAFSYSVSHDLRAPLRSIDGFSHILLEEHASKLDDDARHCLSRVRAASQHMGQLIDALLQLSRVSRADMQHESVDLSSLAQTILDGLRQTAPEREIEVHVAPGLHANGDPRLLQVALQNLLGNAFKFTSKREHAEIEFGSLDQKGSTVFFVRDNGAGFQMEYSNKLFGAFQRLHSVSEFEGTGIGLATVQRIVRRHGGRIWGEGEPDRGATFYFTLS
jgi:PAS domain S-box-containing protein